MRQGWALEVVCFTVLLCSLVLAAPVPNDLIAVPEVASVESAANEIPAPATEANDNEEIVEADPDDAPIITQLVAKTTQPPINDEGKLEAELVQILKDSGKLPDDFNFDLINPKKHVNYYREKDGDHHVHLRLPADIMKGINIPVDKPKSPEKPPADELPGAAAGTKEDNGKEVKVVIEPERSEEVGHNKTTNASATIITNIPSNTNTNRVEEEAGGGGDYQSYDSQGRKHARKLYESSVATSVAENFPVILGSESPKKEAVVPVKAVEVHKLDFVSGIDTEASNFPYIPKEAATKAPLVKIHRKLYADSGNTASSVEASNWPLQGYAKEVFSPKPKAKESAEAANFPFILDQLPEFKKQSKHEPTFAEADNFPFILENPKFKSQSQHVPTFADQFPYMLPEIIKQLTKPVTLAEADSWPVILDKHRTRLGKLDMLKKKKEDTYNTIASLFPYVTHQDAKAVQQALTVYASSWPYINPSIKEGGAAAVTTGTLIAKAQNWPYVLEQHLVKPKVQKVAQQSRGGDLALPAVEAANFPYYKASDLRSVVSAVKVKAAPLTAKPSQAAEAHGFPYVNPNHRVETVTAAQVKKVRKMKVEQRQNSDHDAVESIVAEPSCFPVVLCQKVNAKDMR